MTEPGVDAHVSVNTGSQDVSSQPMSVSQGRAAEVDVEVEVDVLLLLLVEVDEDVDVGSSLAMLRVHSPAGNRWFAAAHLASRRFI